MHVLVTFTQNQTPRVLKVTCESLLRVVVSTEFIEKTLT